MGQASETDLPGRIERMIAPIADSMGYEVVRVKLLGGTRSVLQVMAERKDRAPMALDDCAALSGAVSALLDVEDPIAGRYSLEVSSPGIDRPLVKRRDFERFAGFEAKVETRRPISGRRRFRGRLLGVEGETVRIKLAEGTFEIPLEEVVDAKLVLTDELLAARRNN